MTKYNQSVLCFSTNIGVMQFVDYVRHEQDLRQFNKVCGLSRSG
jgi:hypothetical protein